MAARAAVVLEEIRKHYPDGACASLRPECTRRLQATIRDYAAALREAGETPEQAVNRTRFLIARTLLELELHPGCLMDVAVTWALEGYNRMATPHGEHSVRQYCRDVDADVSENRLRTPIPLGQQADEEIAI